MPSGECVGERQPAVLGHVAVDDKSNEIAAIPGLLAQLDLTDQTEKRPDVRASPRLWWRWGESNPRPEPFAGSLLRA